MAATELPRSPKSTNEISPWYLLNSHSTAFKRAATVIKNPRAAGIIIAATVTVLWLFFYTEIGLTIKSTGDNPHMSRAQGVNVNLNKVVGLAISNGIVALAGALLAQYKGSANINDGRGAIVIGLAAIFIGLSVSLETGLCFASTITFNQHYSDFLLLQFPT